MVVGNTKGARLGETCFKPSTAASTEIAGVMIASPQNSAEPATPSRKMKRVRLPIAR